jgi:hypothetical protein
LDPEALRKLIEDDDLGLLAVKPQALATDIAGDERLISKFQEITEFVRENGREPEANTKNVHEMMLHSRLESFRSDPAKAANLQAHDELGLLMQKKQLTSLSDVFADDDLGLLNDDAENIFELKHVPAVAREINSPDYTARRKPCSDFSNFEPLFQQCHTDLRMGLRKLGPFSQGSQIKVGDFFVLKGVLVYVAEEGEKHQTFDNTYNARLRCIFDNGTESDLLLRSLASALYKDGRRVSSHKNKLNMTVNEVSDDDQQTGFIYVLKSLSQRDEIKKVKNLYKIGFSRTTVEERIKNANKEATYLMAPVAIVSVFQCYNLNPQKLEMLLHHFFGTACLSIDVVDSTGRRFTPREWFIAPLPIITESVQLLISGEIVKYRYNSEQQCIEGREAEDE